MAGALRATIRMATERKDSFFTAGTPHPRSIEVDFTPLGSCQLPGSYPSTLSFDPSTLISRKGTTSVVPKESFVAVISERLQPRGTCCFLPPKHTCYADSLATEGRNYRVASRVGFGGDGAGVRVFIVGGALIDELVVGGGVKG